MINSQSVSYLIDTTITAVAYEEMLRSPSMLLTLANVMPGTGSQEVVGEVGTLDVFEESDDGVEPTDDDIQNLHSKTFVHRERKKSLRIAKTVIQDNRFQFLAHQGEQLGAAYHNTLEYDLADLFHDAFAGARHTAADGSAICASHTYGQTTQNNGSATASLSYANWDQAQTDVSAWMDSKGNPLGAVLDCLLVPTALQETAWQILGQQVGNPQTAERRGNYFAQGTQKLIVWNLLGTVRTNGSNTRWYGLDLMRFRKNLHWYMRSPLEVYGETKMFGTRRVGGYARYSYGVVNPFGLYGSDAS